MRPLKVTIEFEIKADIDDDEVVKEEIYERLQELMEEDALDFSIEETDSDEDEGF